MDQHRHPASARSAGNGNGEPGYIATVVGAAIALRQRFRLLRSRSPRRRPLRVRSNRNRLRSQSAPHSNRRKVIALAAGAPLLSRSVSQAGGISSRSQNRWLWKATLAGQCSPRYDQRTFDEPRTCLPSRLYRRPVRGWLTSIMQGSRCNWSRWFGALVAIPPDSRSAPFPVSGGEQSSRQRVARRSRIGSLESVAQWRFSAQIAAGRVPFFRSPTDATLHLFEQAVRSCGFRCSGQNQRKLVTAAPGIPSVAALVPKATEWSWTISGPRRNPANR